MDQLNDCTLESPLKVKPAMRFNQEIDARAASAEFKESSKVSFSSATNDNTRSLKQCMIAF